MIETMAESLAVSTSLMYVILVLGAFQLGLQAWALVDLMRRERVQFGLKWVWALIILVLSSGAVGAIIYLAWGRRVPQEAPAEQAAERPDRSRAENAVATLYGERSEQS